MHEMSLAQGLIEELSALASKNKALRIVQVRVVLGPFSGVVADSFSFGFNVLKKREPLMAEALLLLDTPEPQYECQDCGKIVNLPQREQIDKLEMAWASLSFSQKKCSFCASFRLSPIGGTELILQQVIME